MSRTRSPWSPCKVAHVGAVLLVSLAPTPPPGAAAQGRTDPPAAACTEPAPMTPAHLYGLWQLTLWPLDG
ncbi:MAG: hypothetical protein K0M67_12725, partial [Thiobacillus sp.]|nr:hypothetical protein [Thiobacillus sp.]